MKKYILVLILTCAALLACTGTALAWDEVFSDDFSSGGPTGWMDASVFPWVDSDEDGDGTLAMNVFNAHLFPRDIEGSNAIMLQFDAQGWMDNFFVKFELAEDRSKMFMFKCNSMVTSDTAQLWDGRDIWLTMEQAGIDGGTIPEPKKNSVRCILINGELSLYIKTENDDDFVYQGSWKSENSQGLIDPTAAYIPGFYVIGSQDAARAKDCQIDNVVIKTLPEFKPKITSYTVDTRPNTKIEINFDYPLTGSVGMSNIYLTKEDGTVVQSIPVSGDYKKYNLMLIGSTWLTEGEPLKLIFRNLTNEHGQKITQEEIDLTAATYTSDFTIGELSKIVGTDKTPLTALEQGTFTLSAKLLPNNPQATSADLIVMVCKGTPEKYSLSDIHYYNCVAAFGDKPSEVTIGEGEFIKIMSVSDFTTGKLVADSVFLMQE